MPDYLNELIERLWLYRDRRFSDRPNVFLDQRRLPNRPPVFRNEFADLNVVAPAPHRQAILETLRIADRHDWFSSMRSSQALTQSVFGTLKVLDKLHLLSRVMADDGGPAFFLDAPPPSECLLENKCTFLGELPDRETKSDVFFGGRQKISVECKLAEDAFGSCSQPALAPTSSNYGRDICDGSYSRQRARRERCSLTEKGILYWEKIPGVLTWDAEVDHPECPLRFPYQLVRNLLAAESGQAVLVYDSHNPLFQRGGACAECFETVRNALHDERRLRRCSWQTICGILAHDSDLHDFVEELKLKFGF